MSQMAWDGVPWMVGGGVKHSTNIARLLAFVAFGGQEGIINPLNLEVRQRAVPDGTVRVAPGACAVLNRNPNVAYDAYAARLPIEDVVAIGQTGSGQWRTDLIVARVENPFLANEPFPTPTPEAIAAGTVQFVRTYVYVGIRTGASNTAPEHPTLAQIKAKIGNDSAIPLATVALPANTGTVMQAHIKDWRTIAQFRESQVMRVANPSGSAVVINGAYKNVVNTAIDVPDWATHFSATITGANAVRSAGNFAGRSRIVLGSIISEEVAVDDQGTGADRTGVMNGCNNVAIPANLRGTTQTMWFQMSRTGSGATLTWDVWTVVKFDVVFHSKPEHDAT